MTGGSRRALHSGDCQEQRGHWPFTAMIAITVTPAAYKALRALVPMTDGAALPGADGYVRLWLDCKFVERLGRMRDSGETYSDVILRLAKASA